MINCGHGVGNLASTKTKIRPVLYGGRVPAAHDWLGLLLRKPINLFMTT